MILIFATVCISACEYAGHLLHYHAAVPSCCAG